MRMPKTTVRLIAAVALAGGVLLGACASAGGPAGAGGRHSSCPLPAQDSVYLAAGPVYRDCAVDRKAEVVADLRPDFRPSPGQLCYDAEVEFVVDPRGLPEVATARLIHSNNLEFADAVRALVPRLKFRPAVRDGSAVRQIVTLKKVVQGITMMAPIGSTPPSSPSAPLHPSC
jgi:hypothetical protein